MRSAQMNTGTTNGQRRLAAKPAAVSRGPAGPGRRPARAGAGAHHRSRLRGLRWVPVPLAVLAAILGLLMVGSLQGQAAADRAQIPDQASGLALSVDTMAWMSNDMTGQGPAKRAPQNFGMAPSMMPGMQTGNNDRLRVEVNLRNVTNDVQRYSMGDFSVVAPGGHSWQVNKERSVTARSADLEPGFVVTVDLYFDIPATKSHHLTLRWSRDGSTVSIPVNTTGGKPGPMRM